MQSQENHGRRKGPRTVHVDLGDLDEVAHDLELAALRRVEEQANLRARCKALTPADLHKEMP
jgi:hypothetical protein